MNIPGYIIERELGHGGMSTVYLAEQESLGRKVALKVMASALAADRNFGERFLREGRTVAQLTHPNILAVYDIGAAGHSYYLAMEYIPGGDLKQRIRQGDLEPQQALDIIKDVASALGYAHEKGLVHRDVKPENILFRENGQVVLTDFGIAKAVGSGTKMTATGMTIGTAHYMSPEQARGKTIDGRADLYSLGVVFYEMLTGCVPYAAEDTYAVSLMHISDPVPQLPGHLRIYQTLIDRLLAKNPDERFADARELMGTVGQGQYASPDQPTQGRSETLARAEAVFTTEILPETKDPAATEIISAAAEARLAGAKSRGNRRQWGISVGVLLVLAALGWGWSVHARQQVQKQWYAAQTSAGQLPVAGQGWTELLTGMEFVWVPGGCFQMGSTDGVSDINLVHEVCVDGYWMGKTEVTQVQWQKIMGGNPSSFKSGTNYPVESVSWDDAQDYIRKLGTQSGKSFRLPTEAEWEYAARSGGKDEKYAGGGNLDAVAWYDGNSGDKTHPVAQKRSNGLGLYDMSGNVWEWCHDWFGRSYYRNSPRNNPQGPSSGSVRVGRGGSWGDRAGGCRSALRLQVAPGNRYDILGFRLVLPAGQ